jgi:hypothetical protein
VTVGFVVLVVGGFLALTVLGGGSEEARGKCERASTAAPSP